MKQCFSMGTDLTKKKNKNYKNPKINDEHRKTIFESINGNTTQII